MMQFKRSIDSLMSNEKLKLRGTGKDFAGFALDCMDLRRTCCVQNRDALCRLSSRALDRCSEVKTNVVIFCNLIL